MGEIYFTMVNRVGAVLGRFGLRRWNIAAFAGSFLGLVDVGFERRLGLPVAVSVWSHSPFP